MKAKKSNAVGQRAPLFKGVGRMMARKLNLSTATISANRNGYRNNPRVQAELRRYDRNPLKWLSENRAYLTTQKGIAA